MPGVFALDAKQVQKRSTVALAVPTVPASNDHTDGSWNATDVYSGEFFVNETDEKAYIRIGASIKELSFGGVINTLYSADDTVGAGRVVTLTDTLYVDGGTFFKLGSSVDGFVYDYTNERTGLGVGVPTAKLNVRGDAGDDIFLLENSAGTDQLIMNSIGNVGMGIAAQATSKMYINASLAYGLTVANSGASGVGVRGVVTGSGKYGVVGDVLTGTNDQQGVRGLAVSSNVATVKHGVYGSSKNSSQRNYGVQGVIPGGATQAPATYSAGVSGSCSINLDSEMYGGRFMAEFGEVTEVYTSDIVAVLGQAMGDNGHATSSSDIVGGRFTASASNTSGEIHAIHVPDTDNTGNILFGADNETTNEALLELASTTKAFLLMRMTHTQAGAITAVNGMVLYVTSTDATFTAVGVWAYEAGAWVKL